MENEYNLLKQQAAQANRLIQASLAQRLRNAGLAEMPLTLQNRIDVGGRGNIGAIDAQQKAMMDYQASLGQQNAANLAAQNLGIEAGRMAFNTAKDLNESNTMFDMWYQLWKKGKITAKQFRQQTGYDVKAWPRKRKPDPPLDPNTWFVEETPIPSSMLLPVVPSNAAAPSVRGGVADAFRYLRELG
jgi:hypothetical protein